MEVYWLTDSNLMAFQYKKNGLTISQSVFLCLEEFVSLLQFSLLKIKF